MKLFKSLLVAPATLGLLAPLSATANEINLNEVTGYSSSEEVQSISDFNPAKEIAVTNSRVDGLEARFSDFEAGSFNSTTTASFSADFMIGAVDGKGITSSVTDGDEDVQAAYSFQIDLNTSFTDGDSLDISLDAGNHVDGGPLDQFDPNETVDELTVDGVSYTFPLGDKTTVFVGDNTDGSLLFSTACTYGGGSDTLDDCGNVNAGITGGGTSAGASYDFGNGFTAAVGFQTTPTGVFTKESLDSYALNVAYLEDTYGLSLTYSLVESGTNGVNDNTYTAINGYWSPEGFPSISAGYEIGSLGGANSAADETLAYFVGLQFEEAGPGTFGIAIGTNGSATEASSKIDEEVMYEAYYSYPVNDGMTITPLIYIQEDKTAGEPDRTGIMVKTSFSF